MRRLALSCIVLLVLAIAAWSALWFYAAHEAGLQLDAWLKGEEAQGRTWTCPDRHIGGYPFGLDISCTDPTFTGRAARGSAPGTDHWKAAKLDVELSMMQARRLAVTLGAPLTYDNSADRTAVSVSWSRLRVDVDGLPNVETAVIRAGDVAIDGKFGNAAHETWHSGSLDLVLDLAQQADIGFTMAMRGATMPVADDLFGGKAPLAAELAGRFGRADVSDAATLPDAIERWRQAGGRVALASSHLSRGDASVSGSGNLGLDDAHRLQGKVDASFVGLDAVLRRYGISGNVAAAGSLLSAIFGSGTQKQPSQPGALNLPIRFQDGRLGIGPFRTQVALPPIY